MTSKVNDLHDDLIYMRKGAGFTASRLLNGAGTLVFVLGGLEESFENLRERFVSAIQSLRDPERDLLMAAFALSPETERIATLKARRQLYGQQIGRKVDTVAAREDAALVNLRNQLLTGWYPASPLNVRVPELHNGILQESVSILTVVSDGCWQETREHYRFFAAFDKADYLTISADWPGQPIPLPEGKSDFTVRTRRVGRSYSHDFIHREPMRRGNTYNLMFKVVADGERRDAEEGRLTEISRAFHERTLTATFETVFVGVKPRLIWSFSGLTHLEQPGVPTRDTLLDLGESSSVRVGFRDLYGGLSSGMAWAWHNNNSSMVDISTKEGGNTSTWGEHSPRAGG